MKNKDAVDEVIEQWKQEIPQLDTDAMETIGRLKRCSALLQPKLDGVFTKYSLGSWEFDVLATLKRSGKPYRLTPTALFSSLMVSSGTMTNRMNQLEKKGLVARKSNSDDARSKQVQLTKNGDKVISLAILDHVDNEEKLLSAISATERKQLNKLLSKLMTSLEN